MTHGGLTHLMRNRYEIDLFTQQTNTVSVYTEVGFYDGDTCDVKTPKFRIRKLSKFRNPHKSRNPSKNRTTFQNLRRENSSFSMFLTSSIEKIEIEKKHVNFEIDIKKTPEFECPTWDNIVERDSCEVWRKCFIFQNYHLCDRIVEYKIGSLLREKEGTLCIV